MWSISVYHQLFPNMKYTKLSSRVSHLSNGYKDRFYYFFIARYFSSKKGNGLFPSLIHPSPEKSWGSNSCPRRQVHGCQITLKKTETPAHSEWLARECSWKVASSLSPFPIYSLSWKCRDSMQNMPLAMSTEDAIPSGLCQPMTPMRDGTNNSSALSQNKAYKC